MSEIQNLNPRDGDASPEQKASKDAVVRYNVGPDAEAWDYDAAASGTDSITQELDKIIRAKYQRINTPKGKSLDGPNCGSA